MTGATVDAGAGVPGGNVPAGTDLGRGVGGGATTVVDIRVDDPPYEDRAGQAEGLCFLRDRPRPGGRVLENNAGVELDLAPARLATFRHGNPLAGWALGPAPSVTGWCTPPCRTPPPEGRAGHTKLKTLIYIIYPRFRGFTSIELCTFLYLGSWGGGCPRYYMQQAGLVLFSHQPNTTRRPNMHKRLTPRLGWVR